MLSTHACRVEPSPPESNICTGSFGLDCHARLLLSPNGYRYAAHAGATCPARGTPLPDATPNRCPRAPFNWRKLLPAMP